MSHANTVDLRSDTTTRPTAAMREAMASAEVGDDVFGEDPTVNALESRVAELLGKERALFVPSGTMANLIAITAQTQPADTVVLHADSHPFNYEAGGLGMISGVMTKTLGGACGILEPAAVESAIVQDDDHHVSNTTLISIENTTNRGGGAIYPIDTVAAISKLSRNRGIRVHCDGARIFNAVVVSGVSAREYARHVDTITFCFSKGLGCPVGSILSGDRKTMDKAHRYRKMFGGGMRQAGVLAAAALYALDHHIERLRDDHSRAQQFRDALSGVPGIRFPMPSPTNIVFIEVDNAYEFVGRLAEQNVFVFPTSPTRLRAVFHLDIDDVGLEQAIDAFQIAAGREPSSVG